MVNRESYKEPCLFNIYIYIYIYFSNNVKVFTSLLIDLMHHFLAEYTFIVCFLKV